MTHISAFKSELTFLAPEKADIDAVFSCCPFLPFADVVLDFLQELSIALLKHQNKDAFPELVALGFWLRKSHITSLQKGMNIQSNIHYKPVGSVLHFTPANVDTMFIYSWVCSLLMGNNNVIRVSRSESMVKDLLLQQLNRLFSQAQFKLLANRNVFVQYDHNEAITSTLSMQCDARVIWGGDESVNQIRRFPCQPRCRDIAFSDRYSVALINGDELNSPADVALLAQRLWRDSAPYEQMACSSPKVLLWMGDQQKMPLLWSSLSELVKAETNSIARKNNHLATAQLVLSQDKANTILFDEGVTVIAIEQLDHELLSWHCGSGLFFYTSLSTLSDVLGYLDGRCQTLSYFGLNQESLLKLVQDTSIKGMDRVVPIGRSLDFATQWDGYDLLEQLSRKIVLES